MIHRNNEWTTNMAAMWYRLRCGFKDQMPLWWLSAIDWEYENEKRISAAMTSNCQDIDFDFDFRFKKVSHRPDIFGANYKNSRDLFNIHAAQNLNYLQKLIGINNNSPKIPYICTEEDLKLFTHGFNEKIQHPRAHCPIEFPNMMVLPMSETKLKNGKRLPAIKVDDYVNPPFICHLKLAGYKYDEKRNPYCRGNQACTNSKCNPFVG